MTTLSLQDLVRHYADIFLDKATAAAIDIVRKHGALLIMDDPIDPCELFEARDTLHAVLDPAYAVTRARLSVADKMALEDGIARRVWNVAYERSWTRS